MNIFVAFPNYSVYVELGGGGGGGEEVRSSM